MAERFGADIVPFAFRGDCPDCGLRRPADGDPCPQCGHVPTCTRQAGCPVHGLVEECDPEDPRVAFAAGLRQLADWFEHVTEWPVPWAVTISSRGTPEQIKAIRGSAAIRGLATAGGIDGGQFAVWPRIHGIDHVMIALGLPPARDPRDDTHGAEFESYDREADDAPR